MSNLKFDFTNRKRIINAAIDKGIIPETYIISDEFIKSKSHDFYMNLIRKIKEKSNLASSLKKEKEKEKQKERQDICNKALQYGIEFTNDCSELTETLIDKLKELIKKKEEKSKEDDMSKLDVDKTELSKKEIDKINKFMENTYKEKLFRYDLNKLYITIRGWSNDEFNNELNSNIIFKFNNYILQLLNIQIAKLYYNSYFNILEYINIPTKYYSDIIHIFEDLCKKYLINKIKIIGDLKNIGLQSRFNIIYINEYGKITIFKNVSRFNIHNNTSINNYNSNIPYHIKKYNNIDINNIISNSYLYKFENENILIYISNNYFKKSTNSYENNLQNLYYTGTLFEGIRDNDKYNFYYLLLIFYVILLDLDKNDYINMYNNNYIKEYNPSFLKNLIIGGSLNKSYQLYMDDNNKYFIIYNKKNVYLNKKNIYKNGKCLYLKINKNLEVKIKN